MTTATTKQRSKLPRAQVQNAIKEELQGIRVSTALADQICDCAVFFVEELTRQSLGEQNSKTGGRKVDPERMKESLREMGFSDCISESSLTEMKKKQDDKKERKKKRNIEFTPEEIAEQQRQLEEARERFQMEQKAEKSKNLPEKSEEGAEGGAQQSTDADIPDFADFDF
ncbi:hypothetical protein BLNAU_2887 [Blattamonas nauphoetae]|uniref:Transcription factor CBF/NF-Y/archaeal histone domain-containing protein n=1 Tax=Blattamonas nauphoetae TaxID=2049346 RepID=A0ABQ9YER1_9EUKA|nr:hypothetical protein BLNAU_2887 [Blattamonas nauphoetae]